MRHGDVSALLRAETGDAPLDMAAPAFWDRSAFSLRAFHRGMGTAAMAAVLEELPEWPSARSFLDIGAGSETLALAVAERRPDMRVALVDLPPMAARISGRLAVAGPAGQRVAVIAGDFHHAGPGGGGGWGWGARTPSFAPAPLGRPARGRRGRGAGGGLRRRPRGGG
ncbi:methyltransferase, partial [Azospirillum brasilense]|nr:methyltransferase [Azospirillum brasilense]